MLATRRRWKSIDYKLPLLASGLVLATAVVLATAAYSLLERALIDATGHRLASSAAAMAQMDPRPGARITDSAALSIDHTLRAYLRHETTSATAQAALAQAQLMVDSLRVYGALLDRDGRTRLAHAPAGQASAWEAPAWPAAAIARGAITGDTLSLGPLENLRGIPSITFVHPLPDAAGRALGYVVETRNIARRGSRRFNNVLGEGITLLIGQPGAGVWTDLVGIAAAPPASALTDSIQVSDAGVSVSASVPGTNWKVWLSQPLELTLAPARRLLWSVVPIGLLIALVAAALMWRVTRRITHPIVQLTEAAENIAADSEESSTPTASAPQLSAHADEVARLRFAFERMAMRVAERQTLELQLRHAQKMEAVGRLAGGVAHDFNNLLTAIRSYSDLMLEDMPAWDAKRSDVLEIRTAAQRAAALTAQLLAFSRKQMLQPRVLDTGVVLREVEGMLQRLLIEDIRLAVDVPAGIWPVKADRGQLEQVIVNLAVNARDAMPQGGTLVISATNDVVLDAIATRHGDVPAGEYVAVRVRDSGVGMDATTQLRVFEPFFTTKPIGLGTGLGLSTVHGIVAQSGGYVTVDSDVGKGATFTVYLPRVHATPDKRTSGGTLVARGSNETILLVEDEQSVRALARRVLSKAGFRVIESASPGDALRLAEMHATEIRLVLSDVVMPEMSGPTLVAKVAELCPAARVLFISGYADDEVVGRGLSDPGTMLLQKPFSAQELVERVRAALDYRPEESVTL